MVGRMVRSAVLVAVTVLALGVVPPIHAQSPGAAGSSDPGSSPAAVVGPAFFPIAPGTSMTPTGLAWQPVLYEQAGIVEESTWVHDLVTWAGGFALLVDDPDGSRVMVSTDGRAWRSSPVPGGISYSGRLAAIDDGLALLGQGGSGGAPGEAFRFTVWRSDDGSAWSRWGGQRVDPPGACLGSARDLVTAGGGLVVLGRMCTPPCCGMTGMPLAMVRDRALLAPTPPERVVAWSSRDGDRWTRRPARVTAEDGARILLRSVRAIGPGPDGLLAVPEYDPQALLTSTDGSRWSAAIALPDGYFGWGDNAPRVLGTDAETLLVGQHETQAALWRLEAGESNWTLVASSVEETETQGLAAEGDTVVVSGLVRDSYGPSRAFGWTLVSQDGGQTFDPSLGWSGPEGSCVRSVAIRDGVAIMVGCSDGGPLLWRAELPGS